MTQNKFSNIVLNRTIGVEVEGYTDDFQKINREGVIHSMVKRDASLKNSYGNVDYDLTVGLEVVTEPFKELGKLDEVFSDLNNAKWSTGTGASTHVHVDGNDLLLDDRVAVAELMTKLEDVMFLMVEPQRYYYDEDERNRYCQPLDPAWLTLRDKLKEKGRDLSEFSNIHRANQALMNNNSFEWDPGVEWSRYNYVNMFSNDYGTVEFRLFHAVDEPEAAKRFALIAYHIVETVKHASNEHLNFIADSVLASGSAEEMVERFALSIGLEFTPEIMNHRLRDGINARIAGAQTVNIAI